VDHHRHLNVVEFLQDMAARGERLELVDDRLQYSARQGACSQEHVQTIRTHRNELLGWLEEKVKQPNEYPLSTGQQGLWMAWRLEPEIPIYNLFFVARLQEKVCLEALRQALQLLVNHHPVLRTCYSLQESAAEPIPFQHVDENFSVELPVIYGKDWTSDEIEAWIAQEAERPFDLEHGPVMRTSVSQTVSPEGDTERLFHWTIHHIASDFLTQEVLIENLENFYRAIRDQSVPKVPAGKLSYRDFVRWEQDIISQQDSTLQAYWQNRVEHWPPEVHLPADLTPVDAVEENIYQSETLDFELDPGVTETLRSFARTHQVSLFTFLLTAYQIVLARYSGRDRFIITTPASVRHLAGWDSTAGYFINQLCLEADLSGNPNVSELLDRTQRHFSTVLEHQMFPFQKVLRMLQAGSSSGAASKPTFSFILDAARQPARAPSLFAETVTIGQFGSPEPISLSMFDMAGELSGQFTYDANRFLPQTMQRLTDALQTVLQVMLDKPEQQVLKLPLVTPTVRQRILDDWAVSSITPGDSKDIQATPLAALFKHQLAKTPDSIALIDGGNGYEKHSITYRELDQWSDRIAYELHQQGAGRETLIGVFVDRSMLMVAGLLGILKTGAAYLPLDPSYPRKRLAYMLEDSAAPLLITTTSLHPQLPDTDAQIIDVDRVVTTSDTDKDWDSIPDPIVEPDDIAYVTYTSGSTGQPKGVQALHRATSNRLGWMWRTMPFAADEVCCQKTALSFVDSVWEIFGPLLQGVPSVIIPAMAVKDVPGLIAMLAKHKVTRIVLVPSLLRAMLGADAPLQQNLPHLRHWVCSGETLPSSLVREFYAQFPDAHLINLYGSSEVAADVTCYDTTELKNQSRHALSNVPIGRPIDNAWCYILDDRLEPVPPGVEGELYVGGDCLAQGYHQRLEMTKERFIANPFAHGRLFRTGDRARWRPLNSATDSNQCPDIEFLGRNDSQVKIRGFRIELSEIEGCLLDYPAVQEAVVQLQAHVSGPRLVAYIAAEQSPTTEELYWHLQQELPDYMVPSTFVILEHLPLTPNGKVDRQSLAQLEVSRLENRQVSKPPANELEQTIAKIWAKLLSLKQVGRHDNFFVLGGHSLLATLFVTQIQAELQVSLPLNIIFDHPTVAELAQQIEARRIASRFLQPADINDSADELDILL
jgi:amino acid adenylation domain-containing protein